MSNFFESDFYQTEVLDDAVYTYTLHRFRVMGPVVILHLTTTSMTPYSRKANRF